MAPLSYRNKVIYWRGVAPPELSKRKESCMRLTRIAALIVLVLIAPALAVAGADQESESGGNSAGDGGMLAELSEAEQAWLEAAQIGPYAPAEEDWDAVYAAAQEEGRVVVYSGSSKFNQSLALFQEAYPGIEVEFYKASQNDLFSKITLEQSSQIYEADIIQFGLTPTIVAEYLPANMAWNYVPPELVDLIDEENREPVLIHRFNFFSVIYNPTLFDQPPIDSWWDLTREEWRGRVMIDDPFANDKMFYNWSTFAEHADEMAAAYEREFGSPIDLDPGVENAGYQWVRDFAENEPIMGGPKDLSNAVGGLETTEQLLSIIVSGRFIDVHTGKANFEPILGLDPIAGMYDGLSVLMANMAPHPNAAKLVIRWIFGDSEGGEGYTPWFTSGLIPSRNDTDAPEGTPVNLEVLTSSFWRYNYEWVYNNLPLMRDFWTTYIVN